jgi:hypothetical protein
MPVRAWVGRFCVADGQVQEEGPWLGSLVRRRPDDDGADELHILVEPASPQAEAYAAQLVDVIGQLYSRDTLSLTGALGRALRAAHDHLREWNRKSLPEHHVAAGASCIALRGGEVYLAQVGPSLAYVRTADGTLRCYNGGDPDTALGTADDFEPRITRIVLGPGDLVLAASTQLREAVPESHVERVLARDPDSITPEFYLLCRDRPNFAFVLLSAHEEQDDAPPGFLTRDHDPDAQPAVETLADQTADVATATASPAPMVLAASGVSDVPVAASAVAAVAAAEPALPLPASRQRVEEITQSTAPSRPAGIRLRGEGAKPSYKKSTGPVPVSQVRIPRLPILIVAGLIILGLLAWWQLPGEVQQSREDRFTALVADAREANARAQATSDPGLRRQLLTEAQTHLAGAAKIHDDNPDVVSLQADVSSAIAVLDAVYEVRDFTTVADLAQVVTGELEVTQAVAGGGNAFFLDAKSGRVLRVPLDGSTPPETIVQAGEPAGFVVAGTPVQIAWSEQNSGLVIIDDQRQAFAYFPGPRGTLPLAVRGVESIGTIDAVAASGGNLYLLDVQSNQVWRYLPGQNGFDSERAALLDTVDLSETTEIAVGQDVYLLDASSGIRRFVGRSEAAFPLAGIDRPLMAAAALTVLPGSNRVVVSDNGNQRIVIATADGEFLRQIVSSTFTDLRAASVDEATNTLYVLNGNTLLRAPFPP